MLLQDAIPDFKTRNFECLTNEDHPEILKAMEGLEVEIVKSEHMSISFSMIIVLVIVLYGIVVTQICMLTQKSA